MHNVTKGFLSEDGRISVNQFYMRRMIVLNGRQLDKIDQELMIEVSKLKKEAADGFLVVKISVHKTLVFSGGSNRKNQTCGNIHSEREQLMVG